MSKEYDKILKETMKSVVDVLTRKVIGLDVVETVLLETKLQITDEREADYIFRVTTRDGRVFLLHIEFQSTNDPDMPYRTLRYWVFMKLNYRLPIEQYLFYIGKAPLTMKSRLAEDRTTHEYTLIDMRDVDCEHFLLSDRPEEIIVAILCNYQKKGAKILISELLHRIKELVKEETLLGKYIKQLEVLSQLRDLQEDVW